MLRLLPVFLCLMLLGHCGWGQSSLGYAQRSEAPIGADSIPIFQLDTLTFVEKAPTEAEMRAYRKKVEQWSRLRYNVRKVYPLALEAERIVKEVNAELARLGKKKDAKAYVKRLEKDLFKKYEPQLRKLTITQGRILIKLINRQTGITAYQLIKEYKSTSSAMLWQFVARVFGSNLKDDFDPETDWDIAYVVKEIEDEIAIHGFMLPYPPPGS